ncbi:hypothetical protein FNW52_02990 [Flavobacterium sp. ZT3R18]|uniref:hypothetical protein n=1 Tax=Flavobacterium sp. ZT3R18 TaxID=2594429 RepID=UPI00117B4900|nr:hypothetical protein [Flavobacterium sp. ZT3R18]TRX37881.1 hypothetical protein FNW52_02990 [Flavobacterium sp. ZT3R18]
MSKQSKITVKHYLNTNLKPKKENGKETYPVYVQVIYDRKIYKFKSENKFFEYLSDSQLEEETFIKFLSDEIKRVERCVILLSKNNEKLLTSKDIYRLSKPLYIIIENNFGKLIDKEVEDAPKSLTDLSYSEINTLLSFLNGFQELDNKNEIVSNVRTCISQINYPSFKDYNINYIVADLYFGDNYIKIYDDLFRYSVDEKTTKILMKDFQYLTEL